MKMLFIQQVRIIRRNSTMWKLLVGLSLISTICGNVINPQNNVDPHQPTNCENSDVLLKVWSILSSLLGPDGKSVKVPDAVQIKYALTLIKKSLQENSATNIATSMKLQNLENELAKNNDVILNDKRPLRTLLDADPVKNDLSSNMLFRYDLPSSIKPSCKAAFLNLINLAQEAYVNMAKSPVCTDANTDPLVQNADTFSYYVPSVGLHQNPYYSTVNRPSEEALKKVTEYLKDPQNHNLNNVFEILQKLRQNPYSQPQINNNALNYNQNHAPNNAPKFDWNYVDTTNHYSPLHGDFNINLEHAKDIANKLNPQNMYKNIKPHVAQSNLIESNSQLTPADANLPKSNSVPNNPNKQMPEGKSQELHYIPFENKNNDNVYNYVNPQQPQNNQPSFGYPYFNPYQNQANLDLNEKLKGLEYHNNWGNNFNNNNNYYPGGLYYPYNKIRNIYQSTLPNEKTPIDFPWVYETNNLILDKPPHDANGVTNGAKLETNIRPKGQVELTYLLKRKRPLIYQPFYFVKYRLPYDYFIQNLKQMLSLVPDLSTPPTELYKGLIAPSNATEVSPDLASYPKEEIHNLVLKDGALVKAKYIEPNVTDGNYTMREPEHDYSDVLFQSGVEHNGEMGKADDELNSHRNTNNNPISNVADLNVPIPNDAVKNRAVLHYKYHLRQGNQNLSRILAAMGLQHMLIKDPNLTVPGLMNPINTLENQAPYTQEIPLNIENKSPVLYQTYSSYMDSAALNANNPPYADNLVSQRNPNIAANPETLGHNPSPYIQANQYQQGTSLAKPGYQYIRPPYLGVPPYRVTNPFDPMQSPYIIGAQAALGLNSKLLGNSLTNNNWYKYKQTRRILGGFLNQNQYGYNRPGLYPNGPGDHYLIRNVLGNQGMIGQPGLGSQLDSGLGFRQPSLYIQPPYFG